MAFGGFDSQSEILLDLKASGLKDFANAIKDAEKTLKNTVDSEFRDFLRDLTRETAGGTKQIHELAARAVRASMFDVAERLGETLSSWESGMNRMIEDLVEAEKSGNRARAKMARRNIIMLQKETETRLRAEEEIIQKREDQLEEEKRHAQELKEMFTTDLPNTIADALGSAASGDIPGLFGIGAKAGESLLRSFGAAAAAVTALAGVLGLIVKTLVDADNQVKEFNSSLMDGSGFADLAFQRNASGLVDVQRGLEDVRKAAFEVSKEYRVLPGDMVRIVAAANQAGLTFKEMNGYLRDSADAVKNYAHLINMSIVYSKALGVSTEEIAEQTAMWQHDFGMGLSRIESSFAAITQIAMQSGISTKRFFSMVSQATSGMAIYNNRIEETAQILADLAGMIGEQFSEDLISDLVQGARGEGYTERFRKIMIAGTKDVSEIMERSARSAVKTFAKDFSRLDFSMVGGGIGEQLRMLGEINLMDKRQVDQVVEALSETTPKELRAALADLRLRGMDEVARRLQTLVEISKGAEGSLGDQAKAMGALDAGANLALKLQTLGNKALSELSAVELAAFESYAGVSGEQLESLIRIDTALRGQWETLKEAQQENIEANSARDKMLAEQFHATIRNGEIVSAAVVDGQVVTGEKLETWGDYLQTNTDVLSEVTERGLSANEAAAMETARQTTTIATLLETGVQYWLEQIHNVLSVISGGIFSLDAQEAEAQAQAIQMSKQQEKEWLGKIQDVQNQLSELRIAEARLDPGDVEGKKAIKIQREALLAKKAEYEAMIDKQGELESMIRETSSWFAPDTVEEVWDEVASAIRKKLGGTGREVTDIAVAGMPLRVGGSKEEQAGRMGDSNLYRALEATMNQVVDEQADAMVAQTEAEKSFFDQQTKDMTESDKEIYEKFRKEVPEATAEEFYKRREIADLVALMASVGVKDTMTQNKYIRQIMQGTMPEDLLARIRSSDLKSDVSFRNLLARTGLLSDIDREVHDFIYRKGTITPIHRADEFVGMKPGGPIDRAARAASTTVNINVRSPQDFRKVYDIVKQAVGHATGRPT